MTDRANQAAELTESLRAMRRNARGHWNGPCTLMGWSIVLDGVRICDLTDAADLIERMQTELAEWRSVFGHLGATPDDCGNAINSKRLDMQDEISRLSAALIPLANAAAPIEREMLTDALYGKAGV